MTKIKWKKRTDTFWSGDCGENFRKYAIYENYSPSRSFDKFGVQRFEVFALFDRSKRLKIGGASTIKAAKALASAWVCKMNGDAQ